MTCFNNQKAILNHYDILEPNIEVGIEDYVISNTDEFGLQKDKKYKILNVNHYDEIEVEISKNQTEIFSIEYFNEYKED